MDDERYEKRRKLGEDAYFDEDDEPQQLSAAARVAAAIKEQNPFAATFISSNGGAAAATTAAAAADEDEDDELDAYMASIEATVKKEKKTVGKSAPKPLRNEYVPTHFIPCVTFEHTCGCSVLLIRRTKHTPPVSSRVGSTLRL